MKKHFLLILIAILSMNAFAQITFEKGYYINNEGQKIECLIKNMDWKNNPTEFEYKLTENAEQNQGTLKLVKEFGIYNYSKYIRSTVEIDRSSTNLDELSTDRNPIFKEEVLFLNLLIEGQANLYQYIDGSLVRFFYSKDNSNNIEQLIFKNYKTNDVEIKENNGFRQQLLNDLKCQDIKENVIENIPYEKKELVNLFIKYNQCTNTEVVNFEEKQKRDIFNLTPRIGLNSSSLSVQNKATNTYDVDFGNELGLRLGIEAEFILSFNKNKWAIIVEPTYQSFKSDQELEDFNVKVDYSSIELPIGIRHYFFLNDNSKLFLNGSYVLDIATNSTIAYSSGAELDISNSSNFAFGFGYKFKDTYSLELRIHSKRNIINTYQVNSSDYSTISVIFGYTIF